MASSQPLSDTATALTQSIAAKKSKIQYTPSWGKQDVQELRRRQKQYAMSGKKGDITVAPDTGIQPGKYNYVYPNGRRVLAPSSRGTLE